MSISSESFQQLVQIVDGSGETNGENILGVPSFVTNTESSNNVQQYSKNTNEQVTPDEAATEVIDDQNEIEQESQNEISNTAEPSENDVTETEDTVTYSEEDKAFYESLLNDQFYQYDERDIDGYLEKFCSRKPRPCTVSTVQQITSVCTAADVDRYDLTKTQECHGLS